MTNRRLLHRILASSAISAGLLLSSCATTPDHSESCYTCSAAVGSVWLSSGWMWGAFPYYSYYPYPPYLYYGSYYYPPVVVAAPTTQPVPPVLPATSEEIAAYNTPFTGQAGQAALDWKPVPQATDESSRVSAINEAPTTPASENWGPEIGGAPAAPAPAAPAPAAPAPPPPPPPPPAAAGQAMPGGGWGPAK